MISTCCCGVSFANIAAASSSLIPLASIPAALLSQTYVLILYYHLSHKSDSTKRCGYVPAHFEPPVLSGLGSLPTMFTPEQFREALAEDLLRNPYDPVLHNGRKNPYSGSVILCEDDYIGYRSVYVVNHLQETAYQKELKHQLATLEFASGKKLSEVQKQSSRELIRRTISCIGLSIACFILFLFCFLPSYMGDAKSAAEKDGYTKGYTASQSSLSERYNAGYDAGYDAGYTEGYSDGASSVPAVIPDRSLSSSGSASQQPAISDVVYITKSGTKYHKAGCSYLKSSIEISKSDAIARGYSACSRCNP